MTLFVVHEEMPPLEQVGPGHGLLLKLREEIQMGARGDRVERESIQLKEGVPWE